MHAASVLVVAPSRLHFGLLNLGHSGERTYGGAGLMIAHPAVRLRITAAPQCAWSGPHGGRVGELVHRWNQDYAARHGRLPEPACHVEVLYAPDEHVGLGLGTQLSLSVAAGLSAFYEEEPPSLLELARRTGRASRSGVGSYGFALGGFILESGFEYQSSFPRLEHRVHVPDEWRFLLIRPSEPPGLSGVQEQQAFAQLPSVPEDISRQLQVEAEQHMVPALQCGDCGAFGESVYRFGYQAGLCYAAQQGGPYNGPLLTELVQRLRSWGVRGVGQSSWGPSLFALTPDAASARQLERRVRQELAADDWQIVATEACNRGATISFFATPDADPVPRPAVADPRRPG